MICPYCGADDDRVIDSRSSENGAVVRRRRHCEACDRRFTTYERVERSRRVVVVKRDGARVPFDGEKIMRGVVAACGKRPIPEPVKAELVESIDEEIHRDFDREVQSHEIGRRVAARLRALDEIAYIRFASEHYRFSSLEQFTEEIGDLRARPPAPPNQQDLFQG